MTRVINFSDGFTSLTAPDIPDIYATLDSIGAPSGIAPLGVSGKISSIYLPSYVDDVIEASDLTAIQALTGETGKIYIALNNGKQYRWSGSAYVEVSPSDVNSVNGQTGIVTIGTDNVSEGATNKYFTDARAKTSSVVNSTLGSETDQASSVSAMKSYVTTSVSAVPSSSAVSALAIDWSAGQVFWKEVSANSTFTFSNVTDGKVISVIIKNTSASSITLTFPTVINNSIDLAVPAAKENVYTFIRSNSKTYATAISGMA